METVKFTFTSEFCDDNLITDYYIDVDDDDEGVLVNVYVDNVDDALINNLTDEELCEFCGLDSEYLIYSNRRDFI